MNTKHYSLITYLSGEEHKKVREIQKELSKITGSRKCLEDWLPHITPGDGPSLAEEFQANYEKELKAFTDAQNPIKVKISGFDGIENWKGAKGNITPYVIWINVEVSAELLDLFNRLRDEITSKYETWLPRTVNYVPHITLAFADLSEDGYKKGMQYLTTQNINETIIIDHIALAECYGENNMTSVEYKKFYFNNAILD
ncbi:MAG: Cyclic phosphodiesterase-like protein [Candidatus Nomurabacteria bacterium]|nr:Cyclic phosphodiesterase-like protein [Candidatus Nomurabacteria bacterium]